MLHQDPPGVLVYSAEYFAAHPSFNRVQAATIEITKHGGAGEALRSHWPEYLMEAAELGMFMVSACVVGVLLGHPASPVQQALPNPLVKS